MTNPENENPYRSPAVEQSADFNQDKSKTTIAERAVVILVGIVVAIPTFFTTCIGGGLVLVSVFPSPGQYGPSEITLIVLSVVCLLIAIWAGYMVARWFYRKRKRRRANSGELK